MRRSFTLNHALDDVLQRRQWCLEFRKEFFDVRLTDKMQTFSAGPYVCDVILLHGLTNITDFTNPCIRVRVSDHIYSGLIVGVRAPAEP